MNQSQRRTQQRIRLPTFVIEPSSAHTHSFILLHGLGSNGEKFGKELLETGVGTDSNNLAQTFPSARFIFPTSKQRRSSAFRRAMLSQWFDIASLDDPSYRSHTQLQGLEESFQEIIELVEEESKKVAYGNIVIGGLSQGCAMALICLLAIDFPIGGFVGMSGWLPFRDDIEELLKVTDEGDSENDLFDIEPKNHLTASSSHENEVQDLAAKVLGYTRDLLSLSHTGRPSPGKSAVLTPIFLGHGSADEKIVPSLGEYACKALRSIGFQVCWRSYREQGHWSKVQGEIYDIVEFLKRCI